MNRFHLIDPASAAVILRKKGGTYYQCALYHRGGLLFAKHGNGFVKLTRGGGTSNPNVTWEDIDPGDGALMSERSIGGIDYLSPEDQIEGKAAEPKKIGGEA